MRVLVITRPGDIPGGDKLAAQSFAFSRPINFDVFDLQTADSFNLDGIDWAIIWSANSPSWALQAAAKVKQAGVKLAIIPNWWSRKARLDFYGYHEQDVAPGYTNAVAQVLGLADVLFVCTMSEAVECWKLAPFKPVHWIGHGCDIAGVNPYENPEDYVSCLARIEPHKNQYNLALACNRMEIPLKLVGYPADSNMMNQCKALGAEIVGPKPRAEALDILAKSRVHALPSFSETPGMSNMEAARLGVPAVMGNIGAEPEFFGPGGIYVDPTDWRQIARGIQLAWQRPRQQWADIPDWIDVAQRALEYMGAE